MTGTSFGYADKLAYREDLGGSLGDAEFLEPKDRVDEKVQQLAALVRCSPGGTCNDGSCTLIFLKFKHTTFY